MEQGIKHEVLRFGDLIYLVNCFVTPHEISVGYAYFEVGIPQTFPLRNITNVDKIAQVFTPQIVFGSQHPVVLGDSNGPLVLKRIS